MLAVPAPLPQTAAEDAVRIILAQCRVHLFRRHPEPQRPHPHQRLQHPTRPASDSDTHPNPHTAFGHRHNRPAKITNLAMTYDTRCSSGLATSSAASATPDAFENHSETISKTVSYVVGRVSRL